MTPLDNLIREWEALKAISNQTGAHYTTTAEKVRRVDAAIRVLREESKGADLSV